MRSAVARAGLIIGALTGASILPACSSDAPVGPLSVNPSGPPPPSATSIVVSGGDSQTAETGSGVASAPAVRVLDGSGIGVAGVRVQFAVISGGGSIENSTLTTNTGGVASAGTWTLGIAGPQTLRATANGVGSVDFTATATPTSGGGGGAYAIELRYNPGSTPTTAQGVAFSQAKSQWESVIGGDLLDTFVDRSVGTCTSPTAINETVDDLVIFVTLETIDGAGGVLGSAGPCVIRSGSLLPLIGQMRLDIADLANLEASGSLNEVIAHEMGHVLGVGSLWSVLGLLADPMPSNPPPPPLPDPHFIGPLTLAAFDSIGGSGYSGAKAPVEDTGGPGTLNSHWRETVLVTELMTGWINPGSNPLSIVSVQSLADMGYTVNTSAAQSFSGPGSSLIIPAPEMRPRLQMVDDVWIVPLEVVEPSGRQVGLIVR